MLLAWDVLGKRRGVNDILPLLQQQHQAHLHDVWKVHLFCNSFILSGLNWTPLGCGRCCFHTPGWKNATKCFINCLFVLWSTCCRSTGGASCFYESRSDAEPWGVIFPWLPRPNSKCREIKVRNKQLVPPPPSFACITLSNTVQHTVWRWSATGAGK